MGRRSVFVSPVYLVNRLYAEHLGAERLSTAVEGPTFDTSREGRGVPHLDVTASRTADGRRIFIKAVNTDPARSLVTTVTVEGAAPAARAEVRSVTVPALDASNSFSRPGAVSVKRTPVRAGRRFVVNLPKHSVSVIALDVAR